MSRLFQRMSGVLVSLLLAAGAARAAEAPAAAPAPLTLTACLAEAAEANPDLRAAREVVARSRADYQAARSSYLPQVNATASRGRSGGENADSPTDANSYGLSASYTLYNGGRDQAGVVQAAAQLAANEALLDQQAAQLTYDLCAAHAQLLYAQEQLRLAELIVRRRADNVMLLQLRYEGGREHKGSLLRMQAAERQAQYDLVAAQRARRVAQRQLTRLLGRGEGEPLVVAGTLAAAAPPALGAVAARVAQTPAHRLAQAQLAAARAGVTLARGRFRPALSAGASAGRSDEDWPPQQDAWSLGLNLALPLFSGGADYQRLQAARFELLRGEAAARSSDAQTAFLLEQAYADYENACDRIGVSRQFLEAAEVRAEISRAQYTSGLLSFDNWDLIENDLISAQKSDLASRRDAVVAAAVWERTGGVQRLGPAATPKQGGDPSTKTTKDSTQERGP